MEMPKTREERRKLVKKLASSGMPEDIKPGTGKIPDEFWTVSWPGDPEGWARRSLIEDRREGL